MILKERKKLEEFFKILISELNNVYHQEDEISVKKLEMMFEFIKFGIKNYSNECRNCKVQIKTELNTLTDYYIIKKISTTLGVNGTQTITCMKYYPFYPF